MEKVSTEALVMQIQGGNKTAVSLLWERLERLFFSMVRMIAGKWKLPAWVELDDFMQVFYFAMMQAVKQYRPDKGFPFTSYLNYHLSNAFHEQLGTRNGKKQILPLSGDMPIGEDNECTILEQIPDESAVLAFERAEDGCFQEQLHEALEECLSILPKDQEYVIRERYYAGKTLNVIAGEQRCAPEMIWQRERKALRGLRRPLCSRKRRPFLNEVKMPCRVGLSSYSHTWTSQPERAVELLESIW